MKHTNTTATWYLTAERGPPRAFESCLVELADGREGLGSYINDERGWEFNGCSGGSPAMIAARTPVWWAYYPNRKAGTLIVK